jgi:hypothetical protein
MLWRLLSRHSKTGRSQTLDTEAIWLWMVSWNATPLLLITLVAAELLGP